MFILNIPEPCHQSWDEMSPETKGRFCGSCQKIVVDFTAMSDEQVKNYLLDKKNTNTCGRFYATQIGRPLENKSIKIDSAWYQKLPFARQVFYAVAVFFVLGVSSCDFNGPDHNANQQSSTDSSENYPPLTGVIALEDSSTLPPPKVNIVQHSAPILKGDVAITEPEPVRELQGAPVWVEPVDTISIPTRVGKIMEPKIDTITEPMIMGGIALPPKHFEKDSSIHIKKPRR